MTTLGARFALARERSGKTQEYLAELCGLTKAAISAVENDRNGIASENVFLLADALGVSARWLMTGAGAATDTKDGPINKVELIAKHLAALPDDKLQAFSIVLGIKL